MADFSETMKSVAHELEPLGHVTASAFALGIQRRHPEYGGGRFERIAIDPALGELDNVAGWLARIRGRYDREGVRASKHRTIDGRLGLVALAQLDTNLDGRLREEGFLRALAAEIDIPAMTANVRARIAEKAARVELGAEPRVESNLLLSLEEPVHNLSLVPRGRLLVAAGRTKIALVDVQVDTPGLKFPPAATRLDGPLRGVVILNVEGVAVSQAGQSWIGEWRPMSGMTPIPVLKWSPIKQGPTRPRFNELARVGNEAVAATADGELLLFDRELRGWVHLTEGDVGIQSIAGAESDSLLATGHTNGEIRVWDMAHVGRGTAQIPFEPLWTIPAHSGDVLDLAFADDGRLASVGGDGLLRVWGPEAEGEQTLVANLNRGGGWTLAVDSLGGRIALGDANGGVSLRDAFIGTEIVAWHPHEGAITALAWSPDGRTLYTAGVDGLVVAHSLNDVGDLPAQLRWIHDDPAKRDALQREGIALGVATQVRRMVVEEPGKSFLVHVDGPWGSGKTTLLGFLEKRLRTSDEEGGPWVVATFDAWRQSKVGPPWLALTSCLRSALARDRKPMARVWLRIREWARLAGAGQWVASALFILIAGALAYFTWHNGWADATVAQTVLSVVTGIAALATLVWSLLKGTTGLLIRSSARRARDFEESQRNPMDDIVRHFSWLLERAGKPVALFIDDLDRCSNEYVVELLDTLQTLIRPAPMLADDRRPDSSSDARPAKPSLVFVVAADGRWIRQSYEEAHKIFLGAVSEPGRPLGYLFLEKLFQVTVDVPSLSPSLQKAFFADLLTAPDPPARQAEVSDDEELSAEIARGSTEQTIVATFRKATPVQRMRLAGEAIAAMTREPVQRKREHALQRFAPLLEPNARSMKRFLIGYNIARMIRTVEGSAIGIEPLAQWMVVRTRWPALADYLARHPDVIGSAGRSAEELIAKGIPEDVATMLADRDGLLKAVIDFVPGDPLDAQKLRECCGMADERDEEAG